MPLPTIGPDTFDYYFVVQELMNGTFSGFGILPPGLILFYYFLEFFITKTIHIIIIQNIITLFSCFFLIYTIYRFYKNIAILATAAISIYIMESYSLLYDFALLTESLYRNSLIIISGMLIIILNSTKKKYWLLFSLFLIFPPLIRSNGLYIYFFLFFITFFLITNKYPKKYFFYLFTPILFLNLVWSTINFSYEKIFCPGNPQRFNSIITKEQPNSKNLVKKKSIKNKIPVLVDYSTSIVYTRRHFYYRYLPDVYENFYISNQIHDKNFKRSDWKLPIDDSLRKLVYKEFYSEQNKYIDVISYFSFNNTKNFWLKLYNLYYMFYGVIINNKIVLLLFFTTYLFSIWKYIKSNFKNNIAFLILLISNIHIFAILSLTVFGWYLTRYICVTEFTIFLTIALSPILFSKNIADAPK